MNIFQSTSKIIESGLETFNFRLSKLSDFAPYNENEISFSRNYSMYENQHDLI